MKSGLHSNEKKIYRTVNTALLACMGLFGLSGLFGIGELSWVHILAAAAVFGVFAGMSFLSVRGRFLCLWTLLICLIAAVAVCGVRNVLDFVQFYFHWLAGNVDVGNMGVENAAAGNAGLGSAGAGAVGMAWMQACELLQAGWIVALSFLLQMLLERFPSVKIWFAGGLFAAMVCCLFGRVQIARAGVSFLLCYIVMAWAEWTEGRWEKAKGGNLQRYMFWIMPFFLLYFVLLMCMPVSEKPYEWKWVREIFSRAEESFRRITQNIYWGGREGFDMTLSDFSERGELGGDLQESAREVMTVQGQRGFTGNVYLTGMVYDTFDGRQWRQEHQGDTGAVYLDTVETLCAVRSYNRAYERDYRMESRLRIRYVYFNTGYVFAPLKTWEIDSDEKNFSFTCGGGNLLLRKNMGYGTEYEVRYFQLNTGQREFDRFLEAALGMDDVVSEEILKEILREYGWKEGTVTPESMTEYRRRIYESYLGEVDFSESAVGYPGRTELSENASVYPDEPGLSENASVYPGELGLSESVAEYLTKITEKAETDVEKLRAIERELASFTYTKTPGALPEWVGDGSEFLDYFLLESRQGYCTHFATAFVLLARAEGIPARYVQGYCVPIEGEKEIYVYSNMAHAWPEAYIAGVGWIPFEPTPGYAQMRYHPWALRQEVVETDGGNDLFEEDFGGNAGMPGDPEEIGETGGLDELSAPTVDERAKFPWKLLGIALSSILAGCVGILVLDNLLGRYRCARMSAEERFRLEVSRNLRLLLWFGLERGERETLQELRERAELSGPLGFIENYEEMIYGGKSIGETEIRAAQADRRALLEILRQRDRRRYFICRLRLYLVRYR